MPLFKLGLGGPLGTGRQYWSWISLADEIGAIRILLDRRSSRAGEPDRPGAADQPGLHPGARHACCTGRGRSAGAAGGAAAGVGEFADDGIVVGQRVLPRVLQETGYSFEHQTAEQALRWATGATK